MEFLLRPWTLDDADDLLNAANNNNIAKFLMNKFPYPYTKEDAIRFINYAMQGEPSQIMAIVVEGKAAGGIGVHPQDDVSCKNAELGYWLAEQYWGNGIITKAIREMVQYGFKHFDINRIFARPYGNNPASQRVLAKAGFTLEAIFEKTFFKNDEYLDEHIYAIRK